MSSIKHCALSAYPLSQNFQANLMEQVQSPIEFFQLAELREKKLLSFFKFLRNLKAHHFYLVLEDPNSQTLLPILQLIAKISSPKKMVVVYSNYEFHTIKIKDIFSSVFKLIKATYSIHRVYKASLRRMSQLSQEPPIQHTEKLEHATQALYLNANLWFGVKAGGSVGHIAGVVNALVKKGMNVEYAAVDKSSLLTPKVTYHQLPSIASFGVPAELNYYYFNKMVVDDLLKKKSKYNFIYQRLSIANYSGVELSQQLKIPLVIEYNGSEAWIAKNWGRELRYHQAAIQAEELCLKNAHFVVTVSEVLAQELVERGVSPEKIVCYPNCIDPDVFNPDLYSAYDNQQLRKMHSISSDALLFTFVGTFGQWHGVEILAQTIKVLIEKEESWLQENNIHFMLVGDGLKMKDVKSILGEHVNKPYVTLTGLIPQNLAPAYLAMSDVLLSPHVANKDGTRFFGSPTKLFEYMAMGKAIIASDLEQIGTVLANSIKINNLPAQISDLKNSELSILCEPGNIEDLQKAIMFVAKNTECREALGHNARTEALKKYTWEKHVETFLFKGTDC